MGFGFCFVKYGKSALKGRIREMLDDYYYLY